MPTLTLGDLDQRVAALDARVRALEAAKPSADTSVSPEPRSADSGPENGLADLKRQLEKVTAQRDEYAKALLAPVNRPLTISPAYEEEIADLKRQLTASRNLALRRRGKAELLCAEVQRLHRALAERDQTISAMRLVTCADQRVAGLETELANARAENARLERLFDETRRQLNERYPEGSRLREMLAERDRELEQVKEAARRELADELLDKLGVGKHE